MTNDETSRFPVGVAYAGIAVIASVYLLQTASPLRVDNDTVASLSVAVDIVDTGVPGGRGVPLGYPMIVAGMMWLGIANAQTLVLLNLAFLCLAMGSVWFIARNYSRRTRISAVALSLLSYPIIRMAPMPEPDMVAFGLVMSAVAVLSAVPPRISLKGVGLLVIATLLTVGATSMRYASLILAIPIGTVILLALRSSTDRRTRLTTLAILIIIAIGIALTVVVTADGTFARYALELGGVNKRGPIGHVINRISEMLCGLGETTLNFPTHRLRSRGDIRPRLWITGVAPLILFFLIHRRPLWGQVVSAYLVGFLVMLTVWPFYSVRLWVPIIPLIVLHAIHCLNRSDLSRRVRATGLVLGGIYVTCGLLALAYTTRISLAGEEFRHRWGVNGGLAAYGEEDSHHNGRARQMIARFDPDSPGWRWLDSLSTQSLRGVEATPGGMANPRQLPIHKVLFR